MNTDYARLQMVNQQVRGWNVYDEDVLDMLKKLPREHFVPEGYTALAFADLAIPLGHHEHMMTPTIEGRLLQALGLNGHENVLEIGTGSGFMTACLAKLSARVTSIDIHADFIERASTKLESAGVKNVELIQMDATQVFFVEALNPHGRLFVVTGDAPAMVAKLVERTEENDWQTVSLFETDLAPLVHGALRAQFTF
jgi:protein-L-isoaspartate(D-aspartate) O-methyltransferase